VLNSASSRPSGRERQTGIEKRKESVKKLFIESRRLRWYLLLLVTSVFIFISYPNLVGTRPAYQLGDVADRDIKASQEFFIEDQAATQAKRNRAVNEILTIYDHDTALLPDLSQRVEKAFADLQAVIRVARTDPNPSQTPPVESNADATHTVQDDASLRKQVWKLQEEFARKLGIDISKGAYRILFEEEFSNKIADAIVQILTKILEKGVVTNKAFLLRESDKGIVLRDLSTKKERPVTDLKQFYGLDQAKSMVRIIGQPLLPDRSYTQSSLIVDLVQRLIQPNITLNKSETEERKAQAADEIKPILYKIKAGEMLLREGERVTDIQLLKLNTLQSQMKKEDLLTSSIGATLLIFCLLVTAYSLYGPILGQSTGEQNKSLIFMALVLVTFFFVAQLSVYLSETLGTKGPATLNVTSITYGIPLAAGSMTICLYLGLNLALPFAAILAICTAIIFPFNFMFFLYFLVNGTLAAYWLRDCKERKVFIKAGAKLGLVNIFLVTTINIYNAELSTSKLIWDWVFAFMGGIGAGILTAGIAPMVEIIFDYTTDIKLLELANLDRPILKRLLIEAPGTYHHSVVVGSMVEAAASEIGANPVLAKVCGYYHDIGKMNKPMYFIENQAGGKNKHDKLAPSMSSLILVAHVKDGIEMARKNKLGRMIVDTIQQHHGTSLITYFYDKAKQQKGEDAVNIDDFRYPGPRPQTKEIALVMLADVAEAASRTLANPTPSRIQGLVQNLINKVFSDSQLDNCELTLKDLHKIAKSFNQILNAIHHHRIDYPDKRPAGNGKGKNGSPDRQQAKKTQTIAIDNPEESPGRLKRLGQS